MKWQTKSELKSLLCNLLQYKSISGSDDEIAVVEYLYHLLKSEAYFQENPHHLKTDALDDGRQLLTALVKSQKPTKKTIILLSHIDVVDIEDYGSFSNLAFHPLELTEEFNQQKHKLPDEVQADLESNGDWLFGRGSMDMKAGTTLHMSMLERAINGEWDGNIILLAVPDEEVNSAGMLKAISTLNHIKEQEDLEYILCMNSEPMFRQYPNDPNMYLYSGSLGKILPGFLCYGKETHVGEPFHGLNANLMISYLNTNLELNETLMEKVGDEVVPPPISLMNRDLKDRYSVQTPVTAVSMYNVLMMEQSVQQISQKLYQIMEKTKSQIEQHMIRQSSYFSEVAGDERESVEFEVSILDYDQLYEEAVNRYGQHEVQRRLNLLLHDREQGDRDFGTLIVQELAYLCKDLAPMMVMFYSPPYYPSVSSRTNQLVTGLCERVSDYMKEEFNLEAKTINYFNGISDLSFIGNDPHKQSNIDELSKNMPLERLGLSFLDSLKTDLEVPSINIGPLGKDAHQWTERLEMNYSFEELPSVLSMAIREAFLKSD
ncbi:M20/M25/M40 family metallo-hydrolase [Filobacillus milosensis]|uniref:M20/M25/M40 family metallo-hydrolase n=2 Tax=Filobacillus milosensis TaxID=94137 RepID=A0A4Y8IQF8_9BACI|nr:M20/M25/M40 family metallo-hydrolase [Filobacillus milosensis]